MSNDYRIRVEATPGRIRAPIVGGHVSEESSHRADAAEIRRVGLCATCAHRREVPNSRGSVFYLCRLSASDPAYPRYPRLPVLSCAGYQHQR